MTNSVGAFLIYHAALGGKVLPEHFSANFSDGKAVSNLVTVNGDKHDVLKRLVELFSNEDDWILDINSLQGAHVYSFNIFILII